MEGQALGILLVNIELLMGVLMILEFRSEIFLGDLSLEAE